MPIDHPQQASYLKPTHNHAALAKFSSAPARYRHSIRNFVIIDPMREVHHFSKERSYELGSNCRKLEAISGEVKEKWGKLTDGDLTVIAGKRDKLLGRIQELYGIGKEEAEKQIKQWESSKK